MAGSSKRFDPLLMRKFRQKWQVANHIISINDSVHSLSATTHGAWQGSEVSTFASWIFFYCLQQSYSPAYASSSLLSASRLGVTCHACHVASPLVAFLPRHDSTRCGPFSSLPSLCLQARQSQILQFLKWVIQYLPASYCQDAAFCLQSESLEFGVTPSNRNITFQDIKTWRRVVAMASRFQNQNACPIKPNDEHQQHDSKQRFPFTAPAIIPQ